MSERQMLYPGPGPIEHVSALSPAGALRMECLRLAKGDLGAAKLMWLWVRDDPVRLTAPAKEDPYRE